VRAKAAGNTAEQLITAGSDEVGLAGPGGAGWPGLTRVRDLVNRFPLLADAAFVIVMLVALGTPRGGTLNDAVLGSQHQAVELVLSALLCAALIWRRRFPLIVFGFMCVVASVQWLAGYVLVADAALLVALYTVAAHRSRRQSLIAAAVLELGIGGVVVRWTPAPGTLPLFIFLTGMALAAYVLGVNIQTRRAYLASLEDRARRAEHERDQQSQIAAATERTRIAREMHDIVAHNLSVMIALADGAAYAARTGSPDAERAARQVSDTGRQALTEMQRLLGVLRGSEPAASRAPQPGVEALDDLVNQVRAAGLATTLTITGAPFPLPATVALAVYRVTQEALTNVLKHANSPSDAKVVLAYAEPVVTLTITDDGKAGRERVGHAGHGLTGMAERVAMFGARIDAGPVPDAGWRVHTSISVDPRPAPTTPPALPPTSTETSIATALAAPSTAQDTR
jgi:signal transduction histidine kinase